MTPNKIFNSIEPGRAPNFCYVTISVFNQSRPGQRINSLHVIETDAAYRNPRFRSIPLDNYQGWGSRKKNYLLRDVQIITKENILIPRLLIFNSSTKLLNK